MYRSAFSSSGAAAVREASTSLSQMQNHVQNRKVLTAVHRKNNTVVQFYHILHFPTGAANVGRVYIKPYRIAFFVSPPITTTQTII